MVSPWHAFFFSCVCSLNCSIKIKCVIGLNARAYFAVIVNSAQPPDGRDADGKEDEKKCARARSRWKGMQIRKQMKIKTFKMQFGLTQRNRPSNTQWFDRNHHRNCRCHRHRLPSNPDQFDQTQIFFSDFLCFYFQWPIVIYDRVVRDRLILLFLFCGTVDESALTNETIFIVHARVATHGSFIQLTVGRTVKENNRPSRKLQKWNLR